VERRMVLFVLLDDAFYSNFVEVESTKKNDVKAHYFRYSLFRFLFVSFHLQLKKKQLKTMPALAKPAKKAAVPAGKGKKKQVRRRSV